MFSVFLELFQTISHRIPLPYFFSYKTEFFSFQNNPKNLDGSRSLGLLRKGKTHILAKFLRTHLVFCSYSREGETPSYNRINTVSWILLDSGSGWGTSEHLAHLF